MDVNFIFKIAAIGIIVAVLNQLLTRSGREEYAMITTLAGLVVVLMMIVPQIGNLFQYIKSILGYKRYGYCKNCCNCDRVCTAVCGAQAV